MRSYFVRQRSEFAAATERRAAALRERLPSLVMALGELGAERVWLFGSLVWGGMHPESDLDIAVAGLPAGRFFEAYERLWSLAGEPVDLLAIETAPESLRRRIEETAERLR